MKNNHPFCSIIILNYFGEKVIDKTINSVLNINYPKNNYEIIIVDNNSQDKSELILKKFAKKHKNIKLVFSDKNLGFAKGNNLGMNKAKGEYVILLNNDCLVDKNWLIELIRIAEKDKSIFAVGSKLILYPKYFDYIIKQNDVYILKKATLIKSNLLSYTKEEEINIDFYSKEKNIKLEVPYDYFYDKDIKIKLRYLNQKLLTKNLVININIEEIKKKSYSKVQNAGILVFQDGYGRDISSIVYYQKQNYEKDTNQYNKTIERYAACGASVLYRKSILDKIGLLDENSFMYYEDVDICERARFYGYKTFFSPKSIAYHLHALSSKEWSPFFIYHTEKGRLLHTFFNFPFFIFIKEFIIFFLISIGRLIKNTRSKKNFEINIQYIKIIFYFLINFLFLLNQRRIRLKNIDKNKIKENYQKILSGYWLFH